MRIKLILAACLTIAALAPASASASVVTLGPLGSSSPAKIQCGESSPCAANGYTLLQRTLANPSIALVAPADGRVLRWSVFGGGTLRLRVLRPVGESVIAEGTSSPAINLEGGPNSTSLPIKAGDVIGIDLANPSHVLVASASQPSSFWSRFDPPVPETGLADAPSNTFSGETGEELFYNATITLTPAVAGLTPASGQSAGGETVKIFGSNLDGATGVQFGSKPAIFTVDSANQITATAPAVPASTVDVTVTGPGGTSAISAADKYTFTAPTSGSGAPSTPPSLVSPLSAGKPSLTALAQSASRWRRGNQQAKISRAPLGTTFSFSLSKPATVKLAFTQKASGRKVRGVCKAPTPSNASKRRCARTILAGTLSLPGHAGLNRLRFQGLLPSGKSLKLGNYNVSLTARDSDGLQSAAHSLSFTIVG